MFFLKKNASEKDDTYVVGIGASAGGLEAINELFDNLSDSEHIAFIVVQHLSSDYKSLLVELLGKHTHMPVEEAHHNRKVEAGRVYVIPNNKELTIKNGRLMLSEKESDKGPNAAIDIFFQSLAHDQREYAIGVLLSGTGSDGTRGIEEIKTCGGFVIVQDPITAKFDGMPKSAITSGYADVIVPPSDIYHQIGNYIDGLLPYKLNKSKKDNDLILNILTTVFKRTGYDFLQYKQPTILRRIARRMQLLKLDDTEQYEKCIKTREQEPSLLAKEFFIGVTSFFRDKDAFAALYSDVILKLVESKEEYESLKVWVTACSTGQEAYSIAILIDIALHELNKDLDVKIFASDIDRSSIEFASKGKYQRNQLLGLEKKVVKDYFIETGEGVCVLPRIRKQIVFATHDILKDPPFIKNDLVTCRNFLIYLNPVLQENVLGTLLFSLNPGGYLFLGTSENPALARRGFIEINQKWKIYQRTAERHTLARKAPAAARSRTTPLLSTVPLKLKADTQLAEDFKKVLTEKLGYAGFYISETYEIKEGIGNFKKYLSLPDKLNTLNILKMAPPELSSVLSSGLRKCLKENISQTLKNIRVRFDNEQKLINILIYPPRDTMNGIHSLMLFSDSSLDTERTPVTIQDVGLLQKDQYVLQLEDELQEARTNLQMAIEGFETANEELQSSNEELQSANEELQSSNEELQSLNEELHTLNTEHQLRIKELVELNDDMTNYLQSSLIGQIFLDNKMRIRRFNKAASSVVNIIENDIGRPIDHITQHIKASTFLDDIKIVNRTGVSIEREVGLENGMVYLMRILPYVRQDKVRDGLVITLIDISVTKNLNSLIKGVFDASFNPIFVFEPIRDNDETIIDYVCKVANYSAYHSFGRGVQEERLSLKKDFPELASDSLFQKYQECMKFSHPVRSEITFEKSGRRLWYQASITKIMDGLVMALSDITHQKEAEEQLRNNYDELLIAKETLKELNNQLEVRVKDRTRDLQISEERFRLVASLTNDVIWDWNLDTNSLWWSDGYYEIFGFQEDDERERKHSRRLSHIHPEDRQRVEEAFDLLLRGASAAFNIAYRYQKSNGEYAHILERAMLFKAEKGQSNRLLGAMVDVTKLEQINQQVQHKTAELQSLMNEFKFVTDFMPQMVWATQPDGYFDFFNKPWYDYTGLTFDQAKDSGWSVVIHPDENARVLEMWKQSLETGDLYQTEVRIKDTMANTVGSLHADWPCVIQKMRL